MPVTFVSDILSKAARALGAIQLGQDLSANEAAELLSTWQQLIDSYGLSRANLHTVRSDFYNLVSGKPSYTIGFDPRVTPISIASATNASPTVLSLAAPHGLTVGRTNAVVTAGATGLWQPINGGFIATVIDATTLSIPVDATAFGPDGVAGSSVQVAGEWDSVRPTRITDMNLVLSTGLFVPISLLTQRQEADIMFLNVSAPPLKAYNDENSPLSTITLWPNPDSAYQVRVWSEQALENVGDLAVTDQIALTKGYERFWVNILAIEAAPLYSLEPSSTLLNNAADARDKVQGKNRKSPLLVNDSMLGSRERLAYNYKIGLNQ